MPLCKTGGGSFMVLDLDGTMNNCDDEILNPSRRPVREFSVRSTSDNGNNCAKPMVDEVNTFSGVVFIPICDGDCTTTGGSHATYHVIRVAAFFLDYMSDQNSGQNLGLRGQRVDPRPHRRQRRAAPSAGWFVRYVTKGPVTGGPSREPARSASSS